MKANMVFIRCRVWNFIGDGKVQCFPSTVPFHSEANFFIDIMIIFLNFLRVYSKTIIYLLIDILFSINTGTIDIIAITIL